MIFFEVRCVKKICFPFLGQSFALQNKTKTVYSLSVEQPSFFIHSCQVYHN